MSSLANKEKEGGGAMKVEFYNTFDEMMAAIEQARKAADAKVQPWQAEVKAGDYVILLNDLVGVILVEILEEYRQEHMKNYRFSRAYSVVVPEGELGDIHVSQVDAVIPKELFDQMLKLLREDEFEELLDKAASAVKQRILEHGYKEE